MTRYLGDFAASATVYVFFDTFDSNGASVTMTGLLASDIEIYKDGSVTQRASDSGYTLLDTDGIDFDGATGIHGFSIDLSDNTDAGFYASGSDYMVLVNAVTIDGQTVRFIAATFSIENRSALRPTTAGRTLDVAATGEAGLDFGNVTGTLSGGEFAAGVFGSGAITAAAIAADAIGSSELASSAVDKITSALAFGVYDSSLHGLDILKDTMATTLANHLTDIKGTAFVKDTHSLTDILADVTGLNGDAMRGTNSAALASVCTETRLAELDAANLPTDVAANNTAIAALNDISAADVNAQVLDVLNVDTFALMGQVAPTATPTLVQAILFNYKAARNKSTTTATTYNLYADDGTTVDQTATVSDDGTTYTSGELGAGS